jgi:hypothetical protein
MDLRFLKYLFVTLAVASMPTDRSAFSAHSRAFAAKQYSGLGLVTLEKRLSKDFGVIGTSDASMDR